MIMLRQTQRLFTCLIQGPNCQLMARRGLKQTTQRPNVSIRKLDHCLLKKNVLSSENSPVVRTIHTSRPRYIHPSLLIVLRPISKVLAVLVGKGFRKWWRALPPHKKQIFIDHLRQNRIRYGVGVSVAGTVGFIYYQNHVTVTPYTGRRRFMLLTSEQFNTMTGQLYETEMEEYAHLLLPEKHPMVNQVRRVGNRLLQANSTLPELYSKSWTVTLIDHPLMNCFVLPTGDIIMFRGMMEVLENDDQVAAVLAHEMSHAILDHGAEHLNRGYLLDLLILLPIALIWAILPSDLLAVASHWLLNMVITLFLTLPYSRKLESEADYLGLRLAAKACFDVREFTALWGKMDVLEQMNKAKENEVPSWMSTHPANVDRQKELEKQMPEAMDLRHTCKCPPLSLRDPREPIKMLQQMVQRDQVVKSIPLQKPVHEIVKLPFSSPPTPQLSSSLPSSTSESSHESTKSSL